MNPTKIEYGERYHDDSGWDKRLSIDVKADRVEIDAGGTSCVLQMDELWWVVLAAHRARDQLGMDKLLLAGPSPSEAGDV